MASPAEEIIVTNGPPPSSPPRSIEERPLSPEPPPSMTEVHHDSKKSFKRKYRKLLRKYRDIRAQNEYLHSQYSKAMTLTQQLSNENANILDLLYDLDSRLPPSSRTLKPVPTEDEPIENDLPSPSAFPYDPHYGYTPTPSPPPEVANELTQEQIAMAMIKVEPGSLAAQQGSMGPPPQPVQREDSVDAFKGRGSSRRGSNVPGATISSRKRKDRDSDVEEPPGTTGRKKTRG